MYLTTITFINHNQFYQCFMNLLYLGVDLEKEINSVLFEMIKEVRLHRVDSENTVIEADYQKYTIEILRLFMRYLNS